MLIDKFCDRWLEALDEFSAQATSENNKLYLLIDSAFIPGLHREVPNNRKVTLFSSLPGCNNETLDVSPFLMPFAACDKSLRRMLSRCNGWPMVSVIETPEPFEELAVRLSAWTIVEVDGQRFNFRFSDTRRLPAALRALEPLQRIKMTGPAIRWLYMTRDGRWSDIHIEGANAGVAQAPVLNERQFAILVNDSEIDELMILLDDRTHAVFFNPSRSYALLSIALQAARSLDLEDENLLAWCEIFWKRDLLIGTSDAILMLKETEALHG